MWLYSPRRQTPSSFSSATSWSSLLARSDQRIVDLEETKTHNVPISNSTSRFQMQFIKDLSVTSSLYIFFKRSAGREFS